MSKDRQQRREQQTSATRIGDQIVVTAQPTGTGKDFEAVAAEHEAARDRELERIRQGSGIDPEVPKPETRIRFRSYDQFGKEVPMPDDLARDLDAAINGPSVNLPKAVHHLRKAANALQGDVFQIVVLDCARGVIGGGFDGIAMARIAAVLDLDHNTKGAAADVRAAIEALS